MRLQGFRPCNRASNNLKVSVDEFSNELESLNVFNILDTYLLALNDDHDDDNCIDSSCSNSTAGKKGSVQMINVAHIYMSCI